MFNQTFICHIGYARAVCAVPSCLKVLDQTIIFLGFKTRSFMMITQIVLSVCHSGIPQTFNVYKL